MASEQETEEILSEQAPQNSEAPQKNEARQKSGASMTMLAVRAALCTLVALVFAFVCFLSFFPYTAMRFYVALDLKEMALVSAEKYLSRNSGKYDEGKLPAADGKYADALYFAVNASVDFMNENASADGYDSPKAVYYAKRVNKYVGEYSRYNVVTSLLGRTQKVDEYSVAHTLPSVHPYVCDYADSIEVSRFKAWYILGKAVEMRERVGKGMPWTSDVDHKTLNNAQIDDIYLLLGQLSAYIDCELDRLGLTATIKQSENGFIFYDDVKDASLFAPKDKPFDLFIDDDGRFTAWYNYLEIYFDDILEVVKTNALRYVPGSVDEDRTEHLRYTRYLKILDDFGKSMLNMTAVFYSQVNYFDKEYEQAIRDSVDTWQVKVNFVPADGLRVYNPDTGSYGTLSEGSIISLSDWYARGMLYDYTGFWRQRA